MIELHPEYLRKNGKKEFVILTYEEFTKVKEILEDAEDLLELRKVKELEKNNENIPFDTVKKKLKNS